MHHSLTDAGLANALRADAEIGAARAAAAQNADPYSPLAGCFDRRFWAWKLTDYAEATFQRHVYPLSLLYRDPESRYFRSDAVLAAICRGLTFAAAIQHQNGSFDQAFPNEQSWGATAFLLQPLVDVLVHHRAALGADEVRIEQCARRAAAFVRDRAEQHGVIANHVAGGALGLIAAGDAFQDGSLSARGRQLLSDLLTSQSGEGWFREYDGADPGYQTLCLYYLAEIRRRAPSSALDRGIEKALDFLQWFVHPDGSFGGVYGSRRTAVAYLGGITLLACDFPVARAMYHAIAPRVGRGLGVRAATVDEGNLAPVLTNMIVAAQTPVSPGSTEGLPAWSDRSREFPAAGLYVLASPRRYVIVGAANGGTVTGFDRVAGRRVIDDGGYVGETASGEWLTTQSTGVRAVTIATNSVTVETTFYVMLRARVTTWRFILLRVLSVTVMKNVAAGNRLKRAIVQRLITGKTPRRLSLRRRISVAGDCLRVNDELQNSGGVAVRWLQCGRPFNAIHMASAGYQEVGDDEPAQPAVDLDAASLAALSAGRAAHVEYER